MFCNQGKSQTRIQQLASEIACSCIDSLMMQNIPPRDSILNCFFKGVGDATVKEYYDEKRGLKMSGRKFVIVTKDLLIYLENNLHSYCPAYQQYIDSTNIIIRRRE